MAMDEQALRQRAAKELERIKEGGGVDITYGLACMLPGVHGEPLSELEELWYDRFTEEGHDWVVILNGHDQARRIKSADFSLQGGAALVVCDDTLLAELTPPMFHPITDPSTGSSLRYDDEALLNWRWEVLWALHARLTAKGKDLPPLHEMMSKNA